MGESSNRRSSSLFEDDEEHSLWDKGTNPEISIAFVAVAAAIQCYYLIYV
jgi:hypothetical protein